MSGLKGLEAAHSASIVDCPACKHLLPDGFEKAPDGHPVANAAESVHRDLWLATKSHFEAERTRDKAVTQMRATADQAKYLGIALSAMLKKAADDDRAQLEAEQDAVGERTFAVSKWRHGDPALGQDPSLMYRHEIAKEAK